MFSWHFVNFVVNSQQFISWRTKINVWVTENSGKIRAYPEICCKRVINHGRFSTIEDTSLILQTLFLPILTLSIIGISPQYIGTGKSQNREFSLSRIDAVISLKILSTIKSSKLFCLF